MASKSVSSRPPNFGLKIDKCNLFNSYNLAVEKYDDFSENQNFPDEVYAVGYHRRFLKKINSFFCQY